MKTNFKYFIINSESNIDELKKQFKKLAFQFHPDVSGKDTNKEMQEIIQEYEIAMQEIGKIHNKNYTFDNDYIDIINSLINLHMQDVEIEVCGWFIYLHGNTKPYKNKLKELKFLWNPKKVCWYWKPVWYRKRNKDTWSMNKIRDVYGSEKVDINTDRKNNKYIPSPAF